MPPRPITIQKQILPIIVGVASLAKMDKPATPTAMPQKQGIKRKKESSSEYETPPAKTSKKENSPLVLLPKNPTKIIQISGIKHIPTANLEAINFTKGKMDGLHFKKILISKHYASGNRI